MKKFFASLILSLVLSISYVENKRIKNPIPIVFTIDKLPDFKLRLFYEYTQFFEFSLN